MIARAGSRVWISLGCRVYRGRRRGGGITDVHTDDIFVCPLSLLAMRNELGYFIAGHSTYFMLASTLL